MKKLTYKDVYIGQQVVDGDGTKGEITYKDDIHNISVSFQGGGSGLFCLDESCTQKTDGDNLYELMNCFKCGEDITPDNNGMKINDDMYQCNECHYIEYGEEIFIGLLIFSPFKNDNIF